MKVMAMIFQGTSFADICNIMYNGFSIETGVKDIDTLLNRGGIQSMLWTVALYFFACILGNILDETGVLRTVLAKIAGMPPSIAGKMIDMLPQETKDEIAVMLVNKNKEKIIESVMEYAEKKGISFRIDNFDVQ